MSQVTVSERDIKIVTFKIGADVPLASPLVASALEHVRATGWTTISEPYFGEHDGPARLIHVRAVARDLLPADFPHHFGSADDVIHTDAP